MAHLAGAAEIHVDISGVKNNKGNIRCALFKSEKGFPGETKETLQNKVIPASTTSPVKCDFGGLAAGTYAISVLHDENDDGKLSKNFLGIPTESYGASNNRLPAMSAPTFEDSKVTVDADTRLQLSIQLN